MLRRLVGDGRDVGRHRQRQARDGLFPGEHEQGLGSIGHRRSHIGVEESESDGHGLQRHVSPALVPLQAKLDVVDHLDRLGEPEMEAQGGGEQQAGAGSGRVVPGRRHGRRQVLLPARLTGAVLGRSEVEEQPGVDLPRQRLRHGAAEIGDRRFRRAGGRGGPGGPPQLLHHPGVARRSGQQQMLGDASLARVALGQQARRLGMRLGAVGGGDLPVDTGPQHGVDEGERPLLQDAGPDENLRGHCRFVRGEPGQTRRLRRLGALQDRHGASEAGGVRAQPPELQHRPSTHRGGGDPLHARCRGGDRSDPLLDQRRHERADEERRSAGRIPAGRRELGLRLRAQRRPDQPGDPVGGERRESEDLGRRVHRQHGEHLPLADSRLGGPRRQQTSATDGRAQVGSSSGDGAPVRPSR